MAYQAHRNDENIDEEQRNIENNANTIKNAAKVAEHAGGWAAVAGKAINTADKLTGGKSTEALGKGMNDVTKKAPMGAGGTIQKASNALAESGLGDEIGNAADMAKGGLPENSSEINLPGNKNEIPNANSGNSFGLDKNNNNGSGNSLSEPNEDKEGTSDLKGKTEININPTTIKMIIGGAGGFLSIFLPIILIVAVLFSTGDILKEYITNGFNNVVGFFTGTAAVSEKEFYQELQRVQDEFNKSDGVCVDANLILAALTVNVDADEVINNQDTDPEYNKKMYRQIRLLAAMQIKHKYHSLDKTASVKCGNEETELVTGDNKNKFDFDLGHFLFESNDLDYLNPSSSGPRDIAKNDKDLNVNFFDRKVDSEKNYAYYLYYPAYSTDGTCTADYAKAKLKTINSDEKAELDIGSVKNMKETVFYWNLVDQFIPDYYKDYLPKEEGAERTEAIEKIADQIYSLYESMGPNQTCGMNCSKVDIGTSGLCPNGIEVNGELIELETYVAGVVAAENNWHQGDNIENMKAQAIAARTYAISRTNYCQTPISNSSSAQNYTATTNEYAIRAAQETAGIVITQGGVLTATEYDASAVKEITDDGYILNQKDQLIPYEAASTIGMVDRHKCVCSKYNNGTSTCGNSCHGRGMSQIGARYLQAEGYTFDQILSYYYGEDISLVSTSIDPEETETAENYRNVIMMCTNRAGSSPIGDFTSGKCITKKTSDFKYPSINPYYEYWTTYNSSYPTYEGQCTWYAQGRGVQALVEGIGMEPADAQALLGKFRLGDGGKWYENAKAYIEAGNEWFEISDDIRDVRPGSFVSLQGTAPWHHVVFVETVEYGSDGKAISFTTTERNGDDCAENTYQILGKSSVYIWGGTKQIFGIIFLFGE